MVLLERNHAPSIARFAEVNHLIARAQSVPIQQMAAEGEVRTLRQLERDRERLLSKMPPADLVRALPIEVVLPQKWWDRISNDEWYALRDHVSPYPEDATPTGAAE
jgi:hypothetical protein